MYAKSMQKAPFIRKVRRVSGYHLSEAIASMQFFSVITASGVECVSAQTIFNLPNFIMLVVIL